MIEMVKFVYCILVSGDFLKMMTKGVMHSTNKDRAISQIYIELKNQSLQTAFRSKSLYNLAGHPYSISFFLFLLVWALVLFVNSIVSLINTVAMLSPDVLHETIVIFN